MTDVRILDAHIRFVHLFMVRPKAADDARKLLLAADVLGARVWEEPSVRASYADELTGTAAKYLFREDDGDRGPFSGRCIHLRVNTARSQGWTKKLEVDLGVLGPLAVRLVPDVGIELFLSDDGAAALSFTFDPAIDAKSQDRAEEKLAQFIYRVAQFRRKHDVMSFRAVHPKDDPEAWARVPAEKRAELEAELLQVPGPGAALVDRLGCRGAEFNLAELVDTLLAPLAPCDPKPAQEALSVFTVVRFDSPFDLNDADVRSAQAQLLARLAQAEEWNHAGAVADRLPVLDSVLNAKHWAGVSLQGAAHFVADQGEAVGRKVGFDEERLPRVRDKYFAVHLAAWLQRVVLRRISDEAAAVLVESPDHVEKRIHELRTELLSYVARAAFPEVSLRGAVQNYYRLALLGLGVAEQRHALREALADLTEMWVSRQQTKQAERLAELAAKQAEQSASMKASLESGHKLHVSVAWIEIFLVGYYAMAIAGHFLEAMPTAEHGAEGATGLGHLAILVCVFLGAIGFAASILRPWKHAHKKHGHGKVESSN